MGTEIQTKAYFLGSNPRNNDLNNNSMFLYPYQKNLKNGQHYDSINGYLEYYSKEHLKKTILIHESIFRQQLEELHRLYRRQRDLMSEIKRQLSESGTQNSKMETYLNFRDGSNGKALNLEILADVEVRMQNERSQPIMNLNGIRKSELFCEFLDLNQPFQHDGSSGSLASLESLGDLISTKGTFLGGKNEGIRIQQQLTENEIGQSNLFKALLIQPSKADKHLQTSSNIINGTEQVQKNRIFGVDISKGNYDSQLLFSQPDLINSDSTLLPPFSKERDNSNQSLSEPQSSKSLNPTSPPKSICLMGKGLIDLNLILNEEEEEEDEPPAVTECETDPCQKPDSNENQLKEKDEELVLTAANAIVAISSVEMQNSSHDSHLPCVSLNWFAEIACSYKDEEDMPNGMDYFEFVTLNLTEIKSDECCFYKEPVFDNQKDEEAGLVRQRPRRGQGRRGRQRKDFQREVLPGLIFLSRHEVNEDILAFEELLKARGYAWQSKNGRRRRHSGGSSSPPSDNNRGIRMEETTTLPRWGRRTKRIPRMRYKLPISIS
ncbi:uncharacterized protein LOC124918753 isoform X2 [Impatiens glandulifera]|uniref:uncharacterized protein LOC124918753 isoform X2 n=1 Tax=Impatiens glandulifera TaxID=253017 RepID=UPI001FB06FFC|nr:uncharacterized protein LOC124918753 isoform X2 [Impatiens glandulifera]